MTIGNQMGLAGPRVDDNCSNRQGIEIAGEQDPVGGSDESPTGSVSFGREASIEFHGQHGATGGCCEGDRIAESVVVGSSAKPAGSMPGRQSNCVVEEEQRGPGPGSGERMLPALELGPADNPQRPVVMAYQLPGVINQTTAVPGVEPAGWDGVKVAPRIDPVLARIASPADIG